MKKEMQMNQENIFYLWNGESRGILHFLSQLYQLP